MSEAARAFTDVTAQSIGPKYVEWLRELEERFGDGRVTAAILAEGPKGNFGKLLYRVRDRLALEDQQSSNRARPVVHLEGAALLAVARGEAKPPVSAYTYEARGLTPEEYTEVLQWAVTRRDGA